LAIPLYAAGLSVVLLVLRALTRWRWRTPADPDTVTAQQKSWKDITKYGGALVLLHNVLRLLACLTLVGLSVASVVPVIFGADPEAERDGEGVAEDVGLKLGLCGFYVRVSSFLLLFPSFLYIRT
jgi:hypothetical protein